TPLLVKRACDRALIAAGVKYLTGAQVIGVEPMADGTRKIRISMRDKDQTVTARAFADHRLPASVAKGKGRFSFRYVANAGGKVRVEKIDFEYDVPYAGVRGWMAVQNHARTLVPISRDLLDVAEMVTVENVKCKMENGKCETSEGNLPTLNFEVVVAGGGTGGGPAAMGAARSGAKTLVVEFQHVLGGVATEGRIGGYGGYYDGNVTGFTTELDRGAKAIGKGGIYFFAESEFLRRGVVEAGGEVWLGAMVSGAEVKDGRLTAVKVTLPDGTRVSVPCKVAVDATGNCDLAAAAGCATEYIDPQELSLQGVGMAGQPLGVNCCNSDIGFVDETDAEDLCAFALRSRLSLPDRIWNQSSLVDSRERRRIRGRFRITPLDLLLKRTYPDTVCIAESAFDTHGQTIHPIFFLRGTGVRGQKIRGNVPFRALLPQDVEGILVTGLRKF
ncbi:MAG: FAD-dependent oxidoreductase, partial [Bacteroidales bacterium]|nr:FAD-dependent oxidoreductase [Bacteroidales bacterium]